MKFKIALAAVLVAGLTASLAIAAPATKPVKTTTGTTTTTPVKKVKRVRACRPNVSLILRGDLVEVNVAEQYFTMNVKGTNRHARAYKKVEAQPVRVNITAKTKIKRLGKRVTLAELTIGDRLNVQARVCKVKVKKGAVVTAVEEAPPLAVRVVAKPAKPAPTTTS